MKHTTSITLLLLASAACALAQQPAQPPAPPAVTAPATSTPVPALTSEDRFGIAKLQRDLLLANDRMRSAVDEYNKAKSEADGTQKSLAEKMTAAQKSCKDKEVYDPITFVCTIPKPPGAPSGQ